jgi:CubicO group peptidase (beta-lactamase class C family)
MAVVHHGEVVYRNVAGFADLERRVPATAATRFDWASIAKQFTAFAVAQLVEAGRLRTDDPARRHLPELDLGGAAVTVADLIHHTSGVEDSDGLLVLGGYRPGDPVGLDELVRLLLRQQHVTARPGEVHRYSNGGYSLLAEIVARLTRSNFAAWTDSAIFQPLGMSRSGFLGSPDQLIPDRALPYQPDSSGRFRSSVAEATPGAGGLYATVEDLTRWVRHLLRPTHQARATLRLRDRGRLRSGETLDYAWGLGWGHYRGLTTLGHGGSGPATIAQLVLVPDHEFAVVAAAAGETDPTASALAFRAIELFLADHLAPPAAETGRRRMRLITYEAMNQRPPESDGVAVAPERLERYAGTYRFPEGSGNESLVVRKVADRLEAAFNGRRPFIPLFPMSGERFVMVPWWDSYRFQSDSAGRITGLEKERTGRSLDRDGPERSVARREPDRRFDSITAAPYLGHYYSDELGGYYEVGLADGFLELRHPRHGALRLTPVGGERFGIDSSLLAGATFARQGERIVGVELEAYSWSARSSFRKVASR